MARAPPTRLRMRPRSIAPISAVPRACARRRAPRMPVPSPPSIAARAEPLTLESLTIIPRFRGTTTYGLSGSALAPPSVAPPQNRGAGDDDDGGERGEERCQRMQLVDID